MNKILSVILIISISLSILILSLEFQTFNINSYEKSYYENDLGDKTMLLKDEFLRVSKDIIEYLKKDGDKELIEKHFNQKEVKHMEDVYDLFKLAKIIKYICLVLVATIILYVFIIDDIKNLLSILYKGMFFNYIVILLFALMIKFNFSKYFIYFHMIFFDNDLWLLDPKTDLLIQMMPEEFFVDMVIKIGIGYIFMVVVIQVVSFIIKRYKYYDKVE